MCMAYSIQMSLFYNELDVFSAQSPECTTQYNVFFYPQGVLSLPYWGFGQKHKMYLLHNPGWCTVSAVKLLSIGTDAFQLA